MPTALRQLSCHRDPRALRRRCGGERRAGRGGFGSRLLPAQFRGVVGLDRFALPWIPAAHLLPRRGPARRRSRFRRRALRSRHPRRRCARSRRLRSPPRDRLPPRSPHVSQRHASPSSCCSDRRSTRFRIPLTEPGRVCPCAAPSRASEALHVRIHRATRRRRRRGRPVAPARLRAARDARKAPHADARVRSGSRRRETAPAGGLPFAGAATLDRGALVGEVLRRNPTIAAARSAWRAALARYPQVTALDDPMLGAGIRTALVRLARRRRRVSTRGQPGVPVPGQAGTARRRRARRSRGDRARSRRGARATRRDGVGALRRSMAAGAFARDHPAPPRTRAGALHDAALGAYESGLATQQDPLRVELDETELLHEEVESKPRSRSRSPSSPHCSTSAKVRAPAAARDAPWARRCPRDPEEALAERGVRARPELRAADARVEARRAGEALAQSRVLPGLQGRRRLRRVLGGPRSTADVGLEWNVPLQLGRRRAALEEARAEAARASQERQSTATRSAPKSRPRRCDCARAIT